LERKNIKREVKPEKDEMYKEEEESGRKKVNGS
jgi:hypothetical protein